MITASTARLSPGLALIFFTVPSMLGAQHVFHLHGLDHRERLAGLDLLPFLHRDRNHEPRHRAEHLTCRCRPPSSPASAAHRRLRSRYRRERLVSRAADSQSESRSERTAPAPPPACRRQCRVQTGSPGFQSDCSLSDMALHHCSKRHLDGAVRALSPRACTSVSPSHTARWLSRVTPGRSSGRKSGACARPAHGRSRPRPRPAPRARLALRRHADGSRREIPRR